MINEVVTRSTKKVKFLLPAMRRFFASALEVIEVALIAVVAVAIVRNIFVQPFLVSGNSMTPNFSSGDYLLIDELTYRLRPPERGEVAVFHYPGDEGTYFIKRITGLPGERVVIENGRVIVFRPGKKEGEVLHEPYLPPGTLTMPRSGGKSEFVLGDTEYLVLGDNRTYSFDSRDWGPLRVNEVVGLVRARLWPLGGIRVFAAPQY